MSKKHFKALAEALRDAFEIANERSSDRASGVVLAMERVAYVCQDMNNRFDRRRFLTACGHPLYRDDLPPADALALAAK
jgi:hypothetical protein